MQVYDGTGEGTMTAHKIFDGAVILYNDMHMKECTSQFQIRENAAFFCIDHCREGRIESEVEEGYSYLQEHELRVDNRRFHSGRVSFPLCHYHGISLGFDLEIAVPELQKIFGGFSVDLYELRKKYCDAKKPYVIHNEPGIEHIFSELYFVPGQIKSDYYKVKALELLLYLDALQISDSKEERPYFYKGQVEKIKAIHDLITGELQSHYTLDELASRFEVSLTGMKNCFKEVYGDSMYSYLRRYRMNTAATMLRQNPKTGITEIAGAVGYESPSKFTAAFRQVMGQTPMEYRKAFF